MRRGTVLEVLELGELSVAAVLDAPRRPSPVVADDEEVEEEAVVARA